MGKTQKPDFKDLEKVMREIVLPFSAIDRDIDLSLPKGPRHENDAEHSWSLALIACMLAPHVDPSLDIGKVCQFAIVHDLTEIHAGDTSAFAPDDHHQTKEEREHEAFKKLASDFAHFPWLIECLGEYERQDTEEARYVRSVDKIIPLFNDYINEGAYYHQNKHTKEDFIEFMRRPREKAMAHKGAFEIHEEAMAVLLSHPELFYSGDKPPKARRGRL